MPEILSTKAMRGAECSTDDYMVQSQLRLQLIFPRRKEPSKTPSKKLNTGKLKSEEHQQALSAAIPAALESVDNIGGEAREVEQMWTHMKETVLSAADGVLGRPSRKTPYWFLENEERIQTPLDEKTRIYNRHLSENSAATNIVLREIKAKLQREIRAMNEKEEELQEMADKNDSHGLFEGLKAIYGPGSNAVAPVKSADGSQLHTNLEKHQSSVERAFLQPAKPAGHSRSKC